jgi:hypothetical protein
MRLRCLAWPPAATQGSAASVAYVLSSAGPCLAQVVAACPHLLPPAGPHLVLQWVACTHAPPPTHTHTHTLPPLLPPIPVLRATSTSPTNTPRSNHTPNTQHHPPPAVCPFMIYGSIVQRWREASGAKLRPWPKKQLEQWGPWFLTGLFVAILVWEQVRVGVGGGGQPEGPLLAWGHGASRGKGVVHVCLGHAPREAACCTPPAEAPQAPTGALGTGTGPVWSAGCEGAAAGPRQAPDPAARCTCAGVGPAGIGRAVRGAAAAHHGRRRGVLGAVRAAAVVPLPGPHRRHERHVCQAGGDGAAQQAGRVRRCGPATWKGRWAAVMASQLAAGAARGPRPRARRPPPAPPRRWPDARVAALSARTQASAAARPASTAARASRPRGCPAPAASSTCTPPSSPTTRTACCAWTASGPAPTAACRCARLPWRLCCARAWAAERSARCLPAAAVPAAPAGHGPVEQRPRGPPGGGGAHVCPAGLG